MEEIVEASQPRLLDEAEDLSTGAFTSHQPSPKLGDYMSLLRLSLEQRLMEREDCEVDAFIRAQNVRLWLNSVPCFSYSRLRE